MKRTVSFGLVVSSLLLAGPVSAGTLSASGTWSATPNGPNFNYSITLTNSSSSTDSLGTFWFAWVPGADLLATNPISETTPSGWTETVTHFGASDGYGIQWIAGSGSSLAPGQSLTFGFESADTPAQIAGFSTIDTSEHVATAFVYQGGPFVGDSDKFVVAQQASVPEPSSLALGLVAILGGTLTFAVARRVRKG
jgi:hypothetical protein